VASKLARQILHEGMNLQSLANGFDISRGYIYKEPEATRPDVTAENLDSTNGEGLTFVSADLSNVLCEATYSLSPIIGGLVPATSLA
jgi:hypothetical protein